MQSRSGRRRAGEANRDPAQPLAYECLRYALLAGACEIPLVVNEEAEYRQCNPNAKVFSGGARYLQLPSGRDAIRDQQLVQLVAQLATAELAAFAFKADVFRLKLRIVSAWRAEHYNVISAKI